MEIDFVFCVSVAELRPLALSVLSLSLCVLYLSGTGTLVVSSQRKGERGISTAHLPLCLL